MAKPEFKLNSYDPDLMKMIGLTDHQTVGFWALRCAERVLHFYADYNPEDLRPQAALEVLQKWIDSGKFSMRVIRKAALDSHAAAREVGEDNPARSAARSAGQAVSTAHVRTHAVAASSYAVQAVHRSASEQTVERLVAEERDWQKRCLFELIDPGQLTSDS